MKYYIILLFLIVDICHAQEPDLVSASIGYNQGQVVYLFGNNVHLRDGPNTNADKLSLLPIGSKLIVQDDVPTNYSGKPIWLKVKHDESIGYIRSDFLSMQTFELDGIPHYTCLKISDTNSTLLIRIPTKREPAYIEKAFEVFSYDFRIEVLGNKGLDGIKYILHLDYFSEACGVDGGGKYLFIDASNQWYDAFAYTQEVDGGIFSWWEEIKFPADHKQGDFIQYTSEYFVVVEEGDDYEHPSHVIKHIIERVLHWNGNTITPEFKQQPSDDDSDYL